jgi:hypothetical protein
MVMRKEGIGMRNRSKVMARAAFAALLLLLVPACAGKKGGKGPAAAGEKGKRSARASQVIDGVKFEVKARANPIESGYGLKLWVRISAQDKKEHWIEANPILLEGSYTFKNKKFGFEEGGRMVYPPKRVKIKSGSTLKFTKTFPFTPKDRGVQRGESLDLTVKILGMVTTDGSIVSPRIARVRMKVTLGGAPRLEIQPVEKPLAQE